MSIASTVTNLWSKEGGYPGPLTALYLPDGKTRTNPAEFTDEEIAACGFTGPYTQPSYDEQCEVITWSSENLAFSVTTKPQQWWVDQVKARRTYLLDISDYAMLADAPFTSAEVALLTTMRQALRDIPQDVEADNLAWPTTRTEFRTIFDDIIAPCANIAIDLTYADVN